MKKQSKITNLIVMPLIASAIFLASPALASNPTQITQTEIRSITNNDENVPNTKRGIAGTVTSINGSILIVTTRNNMQYTVDAGSATIMKASKGTKANPSIIHINDIKVGDAIMVRGIIRDAEISAEKVFDGKISIKHMKNQVKHEKGMKMHKV